MQAVIFLKLKKEKEKGSQDQTLVSFILHFLKKITVFTQLATLTYLDSPSFLVHNLPLLF